MKRCKETDCLNCTRERCIYDVDDSKTYKVVKGYIPGLSDRLKDLLDKNNMSQRQLSKHTSISEPTVTAYIQGTRIPRANHIVEICKVLKCSADWLLGLE